MIVAEQNVWLLCSSQEAIEAISIYNIWNQGSRLEKYVWGVCGSQEARTRAKRERGARQWTDHLSLHQGFKTSLNTAGFTKKWTHITSERLCPHNHDGPWWSAKPFGVRFDREELPYFKQRRLEELGGRAHFLHQPVEVGLVWISRID